MNTDEIAEIHSFVDLQAEWARRGMAAMSDADIHSGPHDDRAYYRASNLVLTRRQAVGVIYDALTGTVPFSRVGDVLDRMADRMDCGTLKPTLSGAQLEGFDDAVADLRRMAQEARWTASALGLV